MRTWLMGAGLAAAVALTLAALGHGAESAAAPAFDAAAVVKHRQAVMRGHAADLKAIKAYLEGTASQAAAEEKATALARSIRYELPMLFPAGSGAAEVPASHAKPNIWSEPKRFAAALRTAAADADALAAAVKTGDKQRIAAAFGAMGEGCGSCHRDFKARAD